MYKSDTLDEIDPFLGKHNLSKSTQKYSSSRVAQQLTDIQNPNLDVVLVSSSVPIIKYVDKDDFKGGRAYSAHSCSLS